MVLIHELGHFIVAKKMGIKVEEFGFGFPPRIFGIKKGETLYSINLFPLGGFVKLFGEDEAGAGKIELPLGKKSNNLKMTSSSVMEMEEEKIEVSKSGIKDIKITEVIEEKDYKEEVEDLSRAFFAKPAGQRIAVLLAGVGMNTVLAVVIFYAFLVISGFKTDIPLLFDHKFFFVNQVNTTQVVIDQIAGNSPAQKAGIKPLSKVVSINGKKINNVQSLVNEINSNKGKEVRLVLVDLNNSKEYKVSAIPRVTYAKNQGALGIGIGSMDTATLEYNTFPQKLFSGIIHPVNLLDYNFAVIGKLIGISVQEKSVAPVGQAVSGPVGVYKVFDEVLQIKNVKERIIQALNLAGILSISLAFFNILPIPALDGGRLFFILVEVVLGKKVPSKYESLAHTVGFAVLMTLIVIITYKDIRQFFFNF